MAAVAVAAAFAAAAAVVVVVVVVVAVLEGGGVVWTVVHSEEQKRRDAVRGKEKVHADEMWRERCKVAWSGVMRYGMVRLGAVLGSAVRCGVAWCDDVW